MDLTQLRANEISQSDGALIWLPSLLPLKKDRFDYKKKNSSICFSSSIVGLHKTYHANVYAVESIVYIMH